MIRRAFRTVSLLVRLSARLGSLLAFGLALIVVPLILVAVVLWFLTYFSAVSLDGLW